MVLLVKNTLFLSIFYKNATHSLVKWYICQMKTQIYIVLVDNLPLKDCFSSLKQACKAIDLKYNTVVKQFKESYSKHNKSIYRIELNRIKGRGKSGFK